MKIKFPNLFSFLEKSNLDTQNILLIDKPKGITSFDVIRKLRKELGIKKIGHAGTLDPLASGLLLVGVGDGTKKIAKLVGLPKTYKVEVLLGIKTTTGDLEGKILEEKEIHTIYREDLDNVLSGMVGQLSLAVPLYSAIKKSGKPLYWYARRAKQVEIPVKSMEIFNEKLEGLICSNGKCVASVVFDVSSGTYIRSIVEEVGRRLDVPTTVKELRRIKIGEFDIKNARKIVIK